ncbi:MAG: hypothetical protein ACREND_04205, partial [Gemmatimonadaceae bacterium]
AEHRVHAVAVRDGEIVAAAGDVPCVVFTAHGMAHAYGAHFLLRDILAALGVAAVPVPAKEGRLHAVAAGAWHRMPNAARTRLASLRSRASTPRARGIGVVIDRSRCFPLANGLAASGIRLNLAGREPGGILEPGDDAARFVQRLTTDLLAIVDATGAPLVARVRQTRDLYQGEHLDALPDLVVEWSDRTALGSTALGGGAGARVVATSPAIGSIEGANDYGRSGEHRPGGWFVAAGPGLPRGRLDREPSLLDLAPTFAAMAGVNMPGVDGAPIAELAGNR